MSVDDRELHEVVERLRAEADQIKDRLVEFEIEAGVLQDKIHLAMDRLVTSLERVLSLIESGRVADARVLLERQVTKLKRITAARTKPQAE